MFLLPLQCSKAFSRTREAPGKVEIGHLSQNTEYHLSGIEYAAGNAGSAEGSSIL